MVAGLERVTRGESTARSCSRPSRRGVRGLRHRPVLEPEPDRSTPTRSSSVPGRRGHPRVDLRGGGFGPRRDVHDVGHLQLRPGRHRHVPDVRVLGAEGQPWAAHAGGAAPDGLRGRAALRRGVEGVLMRRLADAPPRCPARRHDRPDAGAHRPRRHDLARATRDPSTPAPVLRQRRVHRIGDTFIPYFRVTTIVVGHPDRNRPATPALPHPPRRLDAGRRRQPRARRPQRRPAGTGAMFSWALGSSMAAIAGIFLAEEFGRLGTRS